MTFIILSVFYIYLPYFVKQHKSTQTHSCKNERTTDNAEIPQTNPSPLPCISPTGTQHYQHLSLYNFSYTFTYMFSLQYFGS